MSVVYLSQTVTRLGVLKNKHSTHTLGVCGGIETVTVSLGGRERGELGA